MSYKLESRYYPADSDDDDDDGGDGADDDDDGVLQVGEPVKNDHVKNGDDHYRGADHTIIMKIKEMKPP